MFWNVQFGHRGIFFLSHLLFDFSPRCLQPARNARLAESEAPAEVFLSSFGAQLDAFFGRTAGDESVSMTASSSSSSSEVAQSPAQTTAFRFETRAVPFPTDRSSNRVDTLIHSSQSMPPIYCAIVPPALDSESDGMLATALSIYVRRGRLPEPGEVLFCAATTTAEGARSGGRDQE